MRGKKKKFAFKPGDPIEIIALDHTSDDTLGWTDQEDSMKSQPTSIHIRGYYVGQDETTFKIAFAKSDESFGVIFNVLKGTVLEVF